MSTAFILWLEKMFSNYNSSDVLIALEKLGWKYLTGGSYKAVYHKPGVSYLIKVASQNLSNKKVEDGEKKDAMAEFLMPNMVRTLPYIAYGRTEVTEWDGSPTPSAWGIQEKCKALLYDHFGVFSDDRIGKLRKMFQSNPDPHGQNIGITKCGRWVQFD